MASRFAVPRLPSVLRSCSRAPTRITTTLPSHIHRLPAIPVRFAHQIPRPSVPQGDRPLSSEPKSQGSRPEPVGDKAYYQLSFTCKPCDHRSHHNISKQGYHKGSILITCPSCRNRHVISDHLGIFGDEKVTIEDIMKAKGELVKRGSLGEDGDIEFWPEETGEVKEEK